MGWVFRLAYRGWDALSFELPSTGYSNVSVSGSRQHNPLAFIKAVRAPEFDFLCSLTVFTSREHHNSACYLVLHFLVRALRKCVMQLQRVVVEVP